MADKNSRLHMAVLNCLEIAFLSFKGQWSARWAGGRGAEQQICGRHEASVLGSAAQGDKGHPLVALPWPPSITKPTR